MINMFSPNLNINYQQMQTMQQQRGGFSIDNSANNSVASNSTSFLAAANTLVFNNSSNASSSIGGLVENSLSSNSSFIQVYGQQQHLNSPANQSKSQPNQSISKLLERNSFSNALMEIQKNQSNIDNLDFDLNMFEQAHNRNSRKSSNIGQALFNDDENLFDPDELSLEEDFSSLDDSNTDQFLNDMSNDSSSMDQHTQPQQTVRFLLENPVKFHKKSSPTKNMPIDLNNNNTNSANNNSNLVSNEDKSKSQSASGMASGKFANPNSVNSSHSPSNLAGFSYNSVTSQVTDLTPQNSLATSVSKTNTSRSLMKLQLMKQQVENMEKKSHNPLHSSNNSIPPSTTTTTTTTTTTNSNSQSMFSSTTSSNNSTVNNPDMIHSNYQTLENSMIESPLPLPLLPSDPQEIIPKKELAQEYNVDTKLEFPTKYHVMQLAKNLQQSTSESSSPSLFSPTNKTNSNKSSSRYITKLRLGSGSSSSKHHSSSSSSLKLQQQQQNTHLDYNLDYLSNDSSSFVSDHTENSNFNPSRISSPASSVFSQSTELDDLLSDELKLLLARKSLSSNFINNAELESQLEKYINNSPQTMPNDSAYFLGGGSSQQIARPSTSCPNDMARLKKLQSLNLTEDEIRQVLKDLKEKQKKENHNQIERRRRFNINDRIKELGGILTRENQLSDKQNKGLILKASIDYIKNLETKISKTKELEDKLSQMTMLNRKLMERISELEHEPVQNANIVQQQQSKNNVNLLSLVNSNNTSNSNQMVNFNNSNNNGNFSSQFQQQSSVFAPRMMDQVAEESKMLDDMLNFYQENDLLSNQGINLNLLEDSQMEALN